MKQLVIALVAIQSGCSFDPAGIDWAPGSSPPDAEAVASTTDAASSSDAAALSDAGPSPPSAGMVVVSAGPFAMGCAPNTQLCQPDELPQRSVELSGFTIDRHEVTWHDYDECVDALWCTASICEPPPGGDDLPVVCVTWYQAHDYCRWLGKRLPSEAEWEKAARGTDGRLYPWGDQPEPDCTLANYSACGGELDEVGQRPAGRSPYGVDDMAGNAFEWVEDWYSASYYSIAPDQDPRGPTTGSERVARGSSFIFGTPLLRTSMRMSAEPTTRFTDTGFRCAR